MEVWRRLPLDTGSSAVHFALSDALVRCGGGPSLWWHTTGEATLILGPAQRSPSSQQPDIAWVRRSAGGTAVFAGPGVLGLDIMLPARHSLAGTDIVDAYRWLGDIWNDSLQMLGIPTHRVTLPEARADTLPALAHGVRAACFGSLSPHEVAVGHRKLVGLAQVRRRAGVLFQSGLHRAYPADDLAVLLAPGDSTALAAELRARALGLEDIAPQVSLPEVMSSFERVLQDRRDVHLIDGQWTEAELGHAGIGAGQLLAGDVDAQYALSRSVSPE